MTDLHPDHNLDRVARITAELGERIREEDPHEVYRHLLNLCAHHPAKAAQVLMCFAAWFDPECPTSVLVSRAQAATAARVSRRLGVAG